MSSKPDGESTNEGTQLPSASSPPRVPDTTSLGGDEYGEDRAIPPPEHTRGNDPLLRGAEFLIYLEFPGQDRPRISYRVYSRMSVRQLYRNIAGGMLDCEDRWIRIFVDNQCLLHLGTVTDRFFPAPIPILPPSIDG
jgi:hypothetical protein